MYTEYDVHNNYYVYDWLRGRLQAGLSSLVFLGESRVKQW